MEKVAKIIYRKAINKLSEYSPELATRFLYFRFFHKKLDLKNPKTLNEKLLWLKLNTYMNNPLVTMCADKYAVRQYILDKGCMEILNDLYGCWDSVEDIKWECLPDSFVLKCNHASGYNILVPDKSLIDIEKTSRQLEVWMHEDYWKWKAEVNYKDIPKKIICEKYLETDGNHRLNDYKVYCFHGVAKYILFCTDDDIKRRFYFFDRNWNLQRINKDSKEYTGIVPVEEPSNLAQLLQYAEILSESFPFVRVDFYIHDKRIYFGEMTFTPCAGLDTDRLPETDILFGSMVNIK